MQGFKGVESKAVYVKFFFFFGKLQDNIRQLNAKRTTCTSFAEVKLNSNIVVIRVQPPTCSSEYLSKFEDTEPELSVSPELFSKGFFFHSHLRSINCYCSILNSSTSTSQCVHLQHTITSFQTCHRKPTTNPLQSCRKQNKKAKNRQPTPKFLSTFAAQLNSNQYSQAFQNQKAIFFPPNPKHLSKKE